MFILNELRDSIDAIAARISDVEPDALAAAMRGLDGEAMLQLMAEASVLANRTERLLTVGAGVIAERSTREQGYAGLAAQRGHRSPVSLVQSIFGSTRADATRAVRLGESLLEGVDASAARRTELGAVGVEGEGAGAPGAVVGAAVPWHEPLSAARLDGRLTGAQHDAIFRGLGQPPLRDLSGVGAGVGAGARAAAGDGADDVPGEAANAAIVEVWRIAAEQLVDEAHEMSAEELAQRARQVRDTLDAEGVQERFRRRYEARSFRTWTDADGGHHARIDFDDEMAAWVQHVRDAALRPRRGGPRFSDASEKGAAKNLVDDPRTNDQLSYDLVMGLFRAGALANAADVFGARQPGVRMIVIKDSVGPRDPFGRMLATGHLEDRGDALPGEVIDRALCSVGHRDVTIDRLGNPLDVGREQRLYTPAQRIALAIRDGGCMFSGCRVPASYCEAHHCDHWHENLGRTDIDRGILLCRYHHMLLHNNKWRITRDDDGPFMLHPPGSDQAVPLRSKSAVAWAWDPPPQRPGWRTASEAGAAPPG